MKGFLSDIMSARLRHCLESAGICSFDDLKGKTRNDLMKIKNLGRKSLTELEHLLIEATGTGFAVRPSPIQQKKPLSPRYQRVLDMRKEGLTFKEIGESIDATAVRARQIYLKVIKSRK